MRNRTTFREYGSRTARRVLVLNQPDVSVVDRISVILEQDRQWIRTFRLASARLVFQSKIVVNDHAVVQNSDHRLAQFWAAGGKLRSVEGDVVRLPSQWREAHIQVGSLEAVQ